MPIPRHMCKIIQDRTEEREMRKKKLERQKVADDLFAGLVKVVGGNEPPPEMLALLQVLGSEHCMRGIVIVSESRGLQDAIQPLVVKTSNCNSRVLVNLDPFEKGGRIRIRLWFHGKAIELESEEMRLGTSARGSGPCQDHVVTSQALHFCFNRRYPFL